MEQALLISRNDLVSLTAMGGSVDTDKFIQFIKIAQDIHVQGYLGTNLLQKIQADILPVIDFLQTVRGGHPVHVGRSKQGNNGCVTIVLWFPWGCRGAGRIADEVVPVQWESVRDLYLI